MSENIRALIEEHHAFYEVTPYYTPNDETCAHIQRTPAGFNVDIYGVRTIDDDPEPPPPEEYALGWAELERIAEAVSEHIPESCSLEVIPFPSVVIIDGRTGKAESLLRLRMSHTTPPDETAGDLERRTLAEIEQELRSLGLTLRK